MSWWIRRILSEEHLWPAELNADLKTSSVALSIKALAVQQEKAAMKAYGSADSGASLGDILGAAIQEKENEAKTKKGKPPKIKSNELEQAIPSKEKKEKSKKTTASEESAKEGTAKKERKPSIKTAKSSTKTVKEKEWKNLENCSK